MNTRSGTLVSSFVMPFPTKSSSVVEYLVDVEGLCSGEVPWSWIQEKGYVVFSFAEGKKGIDLWNHSI